MLNSKGLIALKSALLAGAAAVTFGSVAAQAADEEKVEKVTVTGTRIKQRDFTSVSPLATVSAKEIALTGTVNTEELINTLPQIIPGVTITSNNPSLNGFATADLRGLGAGRTLVLVNGRRANPSSASGLVDLNTIPATLIERIEVISGGASAVYGADAVAGAINFILKDNFEGIQIGSSYSQTEDGLAPTWVADGIIGGKFDGDRGSIQVALQYANRQPVSAAERDFSRLDAPVLIDAAGNFFPSFIVGQQNTPGFDYFTLGGSTTTPWGLIANVFSEANINTVLGHVQPDADCYAANGATVSGTNFGIPNGAIRFRPGGGIWSFQTCPHPTSRGFGAAEADGDMYNFQPDNFLILGNERINAVTFAKYDILPDGLLTAFLDTTFTNSRSTQQLAATPATGLRVKWDLDPTPGTVVVNPYITAQPQLLSLGQLQFGGVIGNSAGLDNRTFVMSVRTNQVGLRQGIIETNAFGTNQGLRGTIPSIDWDWEVYHGFARNETTIKNNNNISRTAMTQLLNACNTTSLALQAAPLGALPNCPFPTNNAVSGGLFTPTTTTNNPLGFLSLSPTMIEFVRINSTDTLTYERSIISANATGDVIDLWGEGAISAAIGFEYREEELDNRTDPAKGSGDIIGFNASESIKGSYDVYELYGEVNVPLITGETLFENLSLVGGYRKSDYSTGAGITETWKYGAEWSPFEWLTFRGIENHAVRAPSAFELFRAGDQNFPAYTDPCRASVVSALPVAQQPARIAACTAWFNGIPYNPLTFPQPLAQAQAFLFGNPNLEPEIADTLTYGVVFNPDWWPVGRLGLSVDRYEIELDNQITQLSLTQIFTRCLAAGGNPLDVNCANAPRDPSSSVPGQIQFVNQSLANVAGVSTFSGVDVNLRWSWDMEEDIGLPGTFGIASLYTWTDESDGAVGLYVGSIGGITPEHKAATSFTYDLEDWSFLVRWAYVGGADDITLLAGGIDAHIPAYNTYDLGGRWSMTDNLELSFGVDNFMDKQPPLWAGATDAGQFNTDTSTYDVLGRQYRLGIRWKH